MNYNEITYKARDVEWFNRQMAELSDKIPGRMIYANIQEAFVASMERETEQNRAESEFWRIRCAEERDRRMMAEKDVAKLMFKAKWYGRMAAVIAMWAILATILWVNKP